MSAAVAAENTSPRADSRPRLTSISRTVTTLRRLPFILILASLLAVGMVGYLVLSTKLQQQAFEMRALQSEAAALGYQQAYLQGQVEKVATAPELARRAAELGMRPNPYSSFVVLETGEVRGVAKPVRGDELPLVTVKSPIEIAEQRAAAVGGAVVLPPQTVVPGDPEVGQ